MHSIFRLRRKIVVVHWRSLLHFDVPQRIDGKGRMLPSIPYVLSWIKQYSMPNKLRTASDVWNAALRVHHCERTLSCRDHPLRPKDACQLGRRVIQRMILYRLVDIDGDLIMTQFSRCLVELWGGVKFYYPQHHWVQNPKCRLDYPRLSCSTRLLGIFSKPALLAKMRTER